MKICITSEDKTLESLVDPRFGRCRYFIIFDSELNNIEAFENPNTELKGGAGIQSAQFIASKNVKVLFTGHLGPNASQTLIASDIKTYTEIKGTVNDVIKIYNEESLV